MKRRNHNRKLNLVTREIPPERDLQVHWIPIDSVISNPRNARTHGDEQVQQIVASILQFGWTNPILVRPDNTIIAGEGRRLAAMRLGLPQVPVIVVAGLSDAQYRALAIADNQLAANAGWDEDLLNQEIAALAQEDFDLTVLGFEDQQLAGRLAALNLEDVADAEDEPPDPPPLSVSTTGDIWLLGDHRLVCGDAARPEDLAALMQEQAADLVFVDPPYNVDYEGHTEARLKIVSDHMGEEQYHAFLLGAFLSCRQIVNSGASLYVCHASAWQSVVESALTRAGFEVRCQIIWAKNTFAWGWGRYKFQHEPIFYAHVLGESDAWYGDKSQSTLWQVDKPTANREHPTMKPVELIERALLNSSQPEEIVADLFGGSGSTLIACERQKRKARLMEIDPRYVDVIISRWQRYSGKEAILQGDGRTFAEISAERYQVAA